MKYRIYCDGAASPNPGRGGWAFIILDENNQECKRGSGLEEQSTNQRMELMAAIHGLAAIQELLSFGDIIELISDSQYLIGCFKQEWYKSWLTNGWRNSQNQPVANKELWQQLLELSNDYFITWTKVKGHSGDYYNELVDSLAVAARA